MSNSQHHQIMKNPIITESVKTSNKPLNLGNADFVKVRRLVQSPFRSNQNE